MKITYNLGDKAHTYNIKNVKEIRNLNFLLSNSKGDFANFGVINNSCKFFGLNYNKNDTLEIFKIIDEITPEGLEVEEVITEGFRTKRVFKEACKNSVNINVLSNDKVKKKKFDIKTFEGSEDRFYLGPKGGMIYDIGEYSGYVTLDLDMKKRDDFGEWGRNYETYEKDGIIFVKYTKSNDDGIEYEIYAGFKCNSKTEFHYQKEWIKKEYKYSKERNSLYERYIYRLGGFKIDEVGKVVIGYGSSEEEALKQIYVLDKFNHQLAGLNDEMYKDIVSDDDLFENPVNHDVSIAYRLSKFSMYNFLNKELNNSNIKTGTYAGFPWFSDIWARDELVALRAFINMGDYDTVRERIYYYLNNISSDSGDIKIIPNRESLRSIDATFWLAKRLGDFIYFLIENERLNDVFSEGELRIIYTKLNKAFNKIVTEYWDFDNELLKVKYADSWMDTVDVNFPLDIQVQFLEFVSFLAVLSELVEKKHDTNRFLDLENLLREKIREVYYRNGNLYNEPFEDKLTCNVFLAYYLYPDLFLIPDWEIIFDNALKQLKTTWGGIGSLSKNDSRFSKDYTGENNISYHQGDSWYWINNLSAICMHDLNEKKYRKTITQILLASTTDILKMGTIGYGSEISSFSEQKAQGCQAQLWSTSTYIEMVDKLFKKRFK